MKGSLEMRCFSANGVPNVCMKAALIVSNSIDVLPVKKDTPSTPKAGANYALTTVKLAKTASVSSAAGAGSVTGPECVLKKPIVGLQCSEMLTKEPVILVHMDALTVLQ